jgi:hydrogenase maturation protease
MRVLVAGIGNALRGDDGFGVLAARRLREDPRCPPGLVVMETGIGGIHMVQELMRGYDALILFDAVDRGRLAGEVALLEMMLPDTAAMSETERRDFFCDMHYATPVRALTLAREIKALPPLVRIIACQPQDAERYGIGLHASVEAAIAPAVELALETLSRFAAVAPP